MSFKYRTKNTQQKDCLDTFFTEDTMPDVHQITKKRFKRTNSNSSIRSSRSKGKESERQLQVPSKQSIHIIPSYVKFKKILRSAKSNQCYQNNSIEIQRNQSISYINAERIKLKDKEIQKLMEQKQQLRMILKKIQRENSLLNEVLQKNINENLLRIEENKTLKQQISELHENLFQNQEKILQLEKDKRSLEVILEQLEKENEKLIKSTRTQKVQISNNRQISLQAQIATLRKQLKKDKSIQQLQMERIVNNYQQDLEKSKKQIQQLWIKNSILEKQQVKSVQLQKLFMELQKKYKHQRLVMKSYFQQIKELKRQNKRQKLLLKEQEETQTCLTLSSNSIN